MVYKTVRSMHSCSVASVATSLARDCSAKYYSCAGKQKNPCVRARRRGGNQAAAVLLFICGRG